MSLSIPPKYLVGMDRNSCRIRRLAAYIETEKTRGAADAALETHYAEFLRRIGGQMPKAGVMVKVDLPKGK